MDSRRVDGVGERVGWHIQSGDVLSTTYMIAPLTYLARVPTETEWAYARALVACGIVLAWTGACKRLQCVCWEG